MRYFARVWKEGKQTLAEFPDCPGCQTYANPGESIEAHAAEALQGWLESHLGHGEAPPLPKARRARPGERGILVPVPLRLAAKLVIRWERLRQGLTQAALAKKARVSQPAVAQLEHPDSNPTLETLEKVAAVLGMRLTLDAEPVAAHV